MKYALILLAVIVGVFVAVSLTPKEATATIKSTPVDLCPFVYGRKIVEEPNCIRCHFAGGGVH